jgi:hypothetical protein
MTEDEWDAVFSAAAEQAETAGTRAKHSIDPPPTAGKENVVEGAVKKKQTVIKDGSAHDGSGIVSLAEKIQRSKEAALRRRRDKELAAEKVKADCRPQLSSARWHFT